MIEMVFIPQPDIMVEGHLLMMRERMIAMKARRMALDSASVFLHKIKDPQVAREKIFQLASIVQNVEAVGLFATDIPYGSNQISRFGVEETVVDGIIVLSSTEEGLERHRYLEVYKLRNTAHLKGRHSMVIGPDGITLFPRYRIEQALMDEGPLPVGTARLPSGVPGLDAHLGGGLLERSVTLVSGSAGTGKSTIAAQFIADGVARGEPGLYVSLEESAAQVTRAADRLALPTEDATHSGLAEVLYLPKEIARASQLLSVLVEKIRAQKTRRLVIDGLSRLAPNGHTEEDLRQLLFALVLRLKALDVTTLFTLEATTLYSSEEITGRGFSPLADNLLVLRYERLPGELRPTLTVVKTRGSAHDFGTHCLLIDDRGVRVGARTGERVPAVPADATPSGEGSRSDTEEWAPGEGDA